MVNDFFRSCYLLKSDYEKIRSYGGNFFTIIFFTQGFWALVQYRIAHQVFLLSIPSILKKMLMSLFYIWQKAVEILTGISIPASTKIGHSFYIGHFGGIIINSNAVIGNDCNISQGVTIGVSGRGDQRGVPIIGDRVYMGANAVLAGKITIGNDVVIAANSLIIQDVESGITVAGVPAVKISSNNSADYIHPK